MQGNAGLRPQIMNDDDKVDAPMSMICATMVDAPMESICKSLAATAALPKQSWHSAETATVAVSLAETHKTAISLSFPFGISQDAHLD